MPNSSFQDTPIGLVGLGLLGSALGERLLSAGYSVHCFNRTPDKAGPLLARGALWSDNPFAACRQVVICVYNSQAVQECLETFSGEFRPGQVVLDATTGGPDSATEIGRRLAASGVDYLETPIAASSEQTRNGAAVAFVGGIAEVYQQNSELLGVMAPAAHYVGEWGAAARFKLVNNLILGLNRAALAEGLALADRLGLEPATTLNVLKQCNAYSGVMDTKGRKMVEGDFTTQARLAQHAKDVRIILEQAAKHDLTLPLSETHLRLLEKGEALGLGDQDNSAIIRVLRGENKPVGTH